MVFSCLPKPFMALAAVQKRRSVVQKVLMRSDFHAVNLRDPEESSQGNCAKYTTKVWWALSSGAALGKTVGSGVYIQ